MSHVWPYWSTPAKCERTLVRCLQIVTPELLHHPSSWKENIRLHKQHHKAIINCIKFSTYKGHLHRSYKSYAINTLEECRFTSLDFFVEQIGHGTKLGHQMGDAKCTAGHVWPWNDRTLWTNKCIRVATLVCLNALMNLDTVYSPRCKVLKIQFC
jgi:hypothetical protein